MGGFCVLALAGRHLLNLFDDALLQVVHPKSDSQRKSLLEAVKEILLFRSLDQEQLAEVLDAMFERKVNPEEYIIRQVTLHTDYILEHFGKKRFEKAFFSCLYETSHCRRRIANIPNHIIELIFSKKGAFEASFQLAQTKALLTTK